MKKKQRIDIQSEDASTPPPAGDSPSAPEEPGREASDNLSPAASPETVPVDSSPTGTESEDDLLGKLAAAQAEAQGHYDRYLRSVAELDNFRKRKDRELAESRRYANHQLLKDLLAIVDNLERALSAAQDGDESASLREGVEMTLKALLKVMGDYGVNPVEAVDRPFDPSLHEAVMQAPNDTLPDKTVIQELQKGYLLHDRLLRPAMVVVSKGSP